MRWMASGDWCKGSYFKLSPFTVNLRKYGLDANGRRLVESGLAKKRYWKVSESSNVDHDPPMLITRQETGLISRKGTINV